MFRESVALTYNANINFTISIWELILSYYLCFPVHRCRPEIKINRKISLVFCGGIDETTSKLLFKY